MGPSFMYSSNQCAVCGPHAAARYRTLTSRHVPHTPILGVRRVFSLSRRTLKVGAASLIRVGSSVRRRAGFGDPIGGTL